MQTTELTVHIAQCIVMQITWIVLGRDLASFACWSGLGTTTSRVHTINACIMKSIILHVKLLSWFLRFCLKRVWDTLNCIQFLQMNDEEGFKCSLALFLTLIVSAAELNRNTQIKRKRIAGRRFSLKSTGKVHRCSRLGKSVTNFRGNIFWLNELLANM